MVESILKMPISKHIKSEQAVYTDNSFTKGVMRYRKIEEGLWLLASELEVKKNIISKALYDTDTKSDFYFLSFAVFEYQFPIDGSMTEMATLLSTTCTFYKPKTEVTTFFYEGTRGRFFNLVFNKQWAEHNLSFTTSAEKKEINEYLNNHSGFINWLDIVPDAPAQSKEIWEKLEKEKDGNFDTAYLKIKLQEIISGFFKHAFEDKRIKNHTALHNPDYANVAAAEKIILNNLTVPFLGVNNIAKAVNLSPTKLKIIFKSVFGFSMLQYHKEKNMLLAMQLIKNSTIQIKNIAGVTGYLSSSKFSATFKKRFGILP
ncbi:MAG TPA: AraC family transcriptional regulator, partial [Ferruginibacter sp.]|nr:AraC family transcriptional regulator [Ferruginibacter sp.]